MGPLGSGQFGDLETLDVTVATAKTAGNPERLNSGVVGVYMKDAPAGGGKVPFAYKGSIAVVARATQSWAIGQKLYHSATNTRIQTNATNATLCGFAAEAKANAVAKGLVCLDGAVR